nr:ATP synthase CF0, subunit B' [Ishige okamurae]
MYDFVLMLATEKTGGLFDFDGTLPVIVLQFLGLMFVLNSMLYAPLLETIDTRNFYIRRSLEKASTFLTEANQLNLKYENKATRARKAAKIDIVTYQKLYKDILDNEMRSSQNSIDDFVAETTKNFDDNKEKILASLDNEIDSLSDQITTKILS